jgi:hypothetical protein
MVYLITKKIQITAHNRREAQNLRQRPQTAPQAKHLQPRRLVDIPHRLPGRPVGKRLRDVCKGDFSAKRHVVRAG